MIATAWRAALSLLVAGALLCASHLALAHRFHFGIAEVSYNSRSESIEVVQTYTSHDMDALMVHLHQRQFDLSDPEDQALLRKYIERQFALLDAKGKRLPLSWIGMTVDSNSVTVYQEVEKTRLSQVAKIRQAVLMDFLPDQINTVNLSEGRGVRTLTYTRDRQEQPAH